MTEPTIRFGDRDVLLISRPWRSIPDLPGFRPIHHMKPGDVWTDLDWNERFLEHLVDIDGAPMPVGVAIAQELITEGAQLGVPRSAPRVVNTLEMTRLVTVDRGDVWRGMGHS